MITVDDVISIAREALYTIIITGADFNLCSKDSWHIPCHYDSGTLDAGYDG